MSASTVNITVEDTSPLIQYEPATAWIDSPPDDALLLQSSQTSFRTTNLPGATVSFTFTGTGISIFGSHGPDHGRYIVSVDNGQEVFMDGSSTSLVANAPLFTTSGLPMDQHTVTITNSPDNAQAAAFDIDYIQFETQASSPQTVDDSDTGAGITYLPDDATWQPNARDFFSGGTSHFSQLQAAAVQYEFEGDAIGLFGSISQVHAAYSVELDGRKTSFAPSVSQFHGQTLLFFDSNLGPGKHQLTLTSDAPNAELYLDFDFAQVYPAATAATPLVGSGSSADSSASTVPALGDADQLTSTPRCADRTKIMPISTLECLMQWRSGHRFTTVEIVGIAAGALLGLCIVLVALILCMKSRRRIQSRFENLEYPFKGIEGLKDRFRRASAAEKGQIRAKVAAAPPVVATEKTQPVVSFSWAPTTSKPDVPRIVTNFPPATSSLQPKVPPIVTEIPPTELAKPMVLPITTTVAPAARSAAALPRKPPTVVPKPMPRVLGPAYASAPAASKSASTVDGGTVPAAVRVPAGPVPKAPVAPGQVKAVRRPPPQITSTAAAAFGGLPQRPQLRPPPIELEADVRGPVRPTRPQTLMLSPVPVATVTFGQRPAEAI